MSRYISAYSLAFKSEAEKVNPHFERFKTSSLRPLLLLLNGVQGKPVMGVPMNIDPALLQQVTAAVNVLSNGSKQKYSNALAWLKARLPAGGPNLKLGVTAGVAYQPGREVRRKDCDGNWHQFTLQEKGNSCGPTCVRNVLEQFTHIDTPAEQAIREAMGLHEMGVAHTGVTVSSHDWENSGSNVPGIVNYLKSVGLREARAVSGVENVRAELSRVTKNFPAIIGWWWGAYGSRGNGGHWTNCMGPTKDGSKFIILDPWNDVQYLDRQNYQIYTTSDGSKGWFNPGDSTDPAVVVTHAK